ncbi:hypothetical protein [Castellaniella sp.]|uniref:HVO_A0114 family putative DNA-binding protein n=1 Tax=Castellaniella sp. TaxID=1955812 RepID=UPI003C762BE3
MRTLTITNNADWEVALRTAGTRAAAGLKAESYQGETLNFESPAAFFAHINERRWHMLREMLGHGTVGVRELARRVGRDVKGVHTDAAMLVQLGLLKRDGKGALSCPYDSIHIDMHLEASAFTPTT